MADAGQHNTHECTITTLDRTGRGVGYVRGAAVAIAGTVPGDVVRFSPRGKRKRVRIGALEAILVPSPDRVVPPCPYVGRCGGCPMQMVSYRAQLAAKRATLEGALRSCAHPPIPDPLPSPHTLYYRNRMDFAVGADGSLGLRAAGRFWDVLDLSTCFLMSPEAVACLAAFRTWMRAHDVAPWDTRTHTGFARALVLREGKHTGERMAIIITAPGELPARDALVSALTEHCTSVLWGVHAGVADTTIVPTHEVLAGAPVFHEELRGDRALRFAVPPNAFFQTNTRGAEVLVRVVRAAAALTPASLLVDLCCGVGTFAIALARDAGRVVGVEPDRSAIDAARENATTNGVPNVTFTAAAAEDWTFPQESVDCLIVDPPRSGLHPRALAAIVRAAPRRIVYVSCNPQALGGDLAALAPTYHITSLQPVDLFPHTPHVETVVTLEPRT